MNEVATCPICCSGNLVELYTTDSLFVIKHLMNAQNKNAQALCKKKIEDLWAGKNATYYSCRECSFEFAHPFVPADAEFYSLVYHSESNYPSEKWEYTVTRESITNYTKHHEIQPRLLEIGAGNGSFLKIISKDLISPKEIFATEFSEAGARSIETLGIKCFHKDFNTISNEDIQGKVNIVCLFQVLEHMTSIHDFFKKMNELTLPLSRIYISVPNIFHRQFFDWYGYHYDLPPIHVGRYNYESLNRLSLQHGWKILRHAIQPTTFKERFLKFIFSQYTQWQKTINTEITKMKLLRLFLRYGIYALLIIVNFRVIIGLRKSELGTAQWFEIEKINLA
jgi:2-polyprenyl-3-methyl-5-hydroxy-6-metoxy-1,4-benzoquinol methylase